MATQTKQTKDTAVKHIRKMTGVVLSDKNDKSRTILVDTVKMHPKFGKIYKVQKKYYAHDADNMSQKGDKVRITEMRPISKTKRWAVEEVVEKAAVA